MRLGRLGVELSSRDKDGGVGGVGVGLAGGVEVGDEDGVEDAGGGGGGGGGYEDVEKVGGLEVFLS